MLFKQVYAFIIFLLFFSTGALAQIELLNDEFNRSETLLSNWKNISEVEQWNAEHLEEFDIDETHSGQLYMMPWTSSWYEDYRGTLIHKTVDQNFIFTTRVSASNRVATGIPSSNFSLAGLMIRTPIDYPNGATAAGAWSPNQENYIFLAAGRANGNSMAFEVKNTINGNSMLAISSLSTITDVEIRVARIDDVVIVLNRIPGGNWEVHARYLRPDFPSELQIGFVTYTDYSKVATYDSYFQNSNVINAALSPDPSSNPGMPFNPDLIGRFDFGRFNDAIVPAALVGVNLYNQATDAELLSFLGLDTELFCPPSLAVQDNVDQGEVVEVHTAIDMTCSHSVLASSTIEYTAGEVIEFLPGFLSEEGVEINALIEDCPVE